MQATGIKRFAAVAAAAVALAGGLTVGASSASADQRDFSLVNGSELTIMNAYVSPSASSNWGPDQLGSDILVPGDSYQLHVPTNVQRGTCFYDIRVVTRGGSEGTMYEVDLCSTSTVTFH